MQVAQADVLRLVDDDGIGIRNIKTVLDDGGTQEHVVVARHEIEDLVFKHLRFHLAVCDAYLHIRH